MSPASCVLCPASFFNTQDAGRGTQDCYPCLSFMREHVILLSFGFRFTSISIGDNVVHLGVLGYLGSVIWIVGVVNAMNFIDGIDSLATVVSITIAIAFGVIAVIRFDVFSLVIMTALGG